RLAARIHPQPAHAPANAQTATRRDRPARTAALGGWPICHFQADHRQHGRRAGPGTVGSTSMLDGVTSFPPEFAARYRAAGYWKDRPLRAVFGEVFARYADRVAVIDGEEHITYRQLDERSTRLALNLLDLGVNPLDRIVVQLQNTAMFCYLYFALQKIGAIPI